MIAKCIAVLAIVAQISASGCNQQSFVLSTSQSSPVTLVSSGSSSYRNAPVVLVSSESNGSGNSDSSLSGGVITRNIIAKGKYPVVLRDCGEVPDRQIPVTTSTSTAPVQVKPVVRLSANIPAPRTISHSCTCYKTILRPTVHQHIVSVPTIERYLETSHKPVVENIQYEAVPVNCLQSSSVSSGSGVQVISIGSESSSGSSSRPISQLISLSSGSGSSSQPQFIEIPSSQSQQIQTLQVPQVETVQVPQIQTVEVPQVQTFQAPQIFTASSPATQTLGSDCY